MPVNFPRYIFGIHDPGEWMDAVQSANKQGWVLVTEAIGADPNNTSGTSYTHLSSRGFGVIVRLNNGYGHDGTIPTADQYDNFAQRCANWVARSPGANIWIIGNEMNLADERPHDQAITPQLYAQCYLKCRAKIKALPGHADDLVVIGGIGPWNVQTTYPGNERGDWVKYLADILSIVKPNCDGVSVHAYTHGTNPNLIFSNEPQGAFPQYNNQFRTYRDFVKAIPSELKRVPVFITESQPTPDSGGWIPESRGWVTNAYREINDWNSDLANQPIQCLLLFRWQEGEPTWSIRDKGWVQDDFAAAIRNEYRVRLPGPVPQPTKVYRVTFTSDNTPSSIPADGEVRVSVTVQNDSNFVWPRDGNTPVRLGYRWYDANGHEVPAREGVHTDLPQDVSPGQRVTISNARVVAPPHPARYQLRLDLVEEGVTWFSDAGSPAHNDTIDVVRGGGMELPDYAVTYLNVSIPDTFPRDAQTNATLTVRNDGKKTWAAGGPNRVRLGYHWFRPGSAQETFVRQLVRSELTRDVATGDSVTLTIPVLAPFSPGAYNLLFDLVLEGVNEFRAMGAQPLTKQVTVSAPTPYYVTWLTANVPATLPVDSIQTVHVSFRNDGSKTWLASGTNRVRLTYAWFNARAEHSLVRQDIRATLPRDIAPGESAEVDIDVLTPEHPGTLTLRFDLVEEGVTFFTTQGSPPLDKAVMVQATQDYQVSFGDAFVVAPRTQFTYNLKIRNDGNRTWTTAGANPVTIGYHWFTADNQAVAVMADLRTPLPGNVAPGDEVVVAATTVSPDKPGRYRLQWSLVVEGFAWFYDLKARTLDMAVEVAPLGASAAPQSLDVAPSVLKTAPTALPAVQTAPAYRASITALTPLASLDADATQILNVQIRNDGSKTWPKGGDNAVHAGYRWYRGNQPVFARADLRTELPSDVAPGQGVSFGAQVVSPPDPDTYTLRFDLVEEGVTWFSDTGMSSPLDLTVQVTRAQTTRIQSEAGEIGLTQSFAAPPIQRVSIQASHNNESAALIIDGDPNTAWTSGQPMRPDMWVQADLGTLRTIDAIAVRSGGRGFAEGYQVLVSSDGQNWVQVGSRERVRSDFAVTFAPMNLRYIKIVQTGQPQWATPWQIADLSVHDAPLWQATATHNAAQVQLAFDNDPQTLWTTGVPQQPGMSYTLDIGAAQLISGLTLDNGSKSEYPMGYNVQVSADGQTWSVIGASAPTGNWAPVSLTFDPLLARYIHIECTASNRWHPWSIAEIYVIRNVSDWEVVQR